MNVGNFLPHEGYEALRASFNRSVLLSPETAEIRALTAVNFVNFAAVLEGRAA
jgi:hypothetical protein